MSQWAEIRRLHLVEGASKKEIARRLQLDVKTVRRAVERPTPPVRESLPRVQVAQILRQPAQQPQLLDPQVRGLQMPAAVARVRPLRPAAPARLAPSPATGLPTGTSAAAGTSQPSEPATARTGTSPPAPDPSGGLLPRSLPTAPSPRALVDFAPQPPRR